MEARLSAYQIGGGMGLISRILAITLPVTFYLIIGRVLKNENKGIIRKSYDYLALVFCFIGLVSTGTKSSILMLIYLLFVYTLFNSQFGNFSLISKNIKKYQKMIFIVACIVALIVIFIEKSFLDNQSDSPFFLLALRFILSGDIFMMAYQNDVLTEMKYANPMVVIFADLIGMLRLIPWEELPQELGNQLYQYNIGGDLPKGPNPQHNVFGIFYFGYFGSLIYSYLVGILVSFIRNKSIYLFPSSTLGGVFFMLIFLTAPTFFTDITYAIQQLNNIFFVAIPILLLVKFLKLGFIK
jgi:hypothetical protein